MIETVRTIIRVMPRGGSFPSLVETMSGRRFIMKLSGVGQGTSGLRTEFIATRLADAFGLRVPRVAPLLLTKTMPWQTGTDEFYEAVQRSAGWNLGVEFIEGARDITANSLADIPADFLDRLALADSLVQNVDRTAENPNILRDRSGVYWAIDFGASLFLGRFTSLGSLMKFELPNNHLLADRQVTHRRLENPHMPLREIVCDLPGAWIDTVSGGRQVLLETLQNLIAKWMEDA